jgi:hypothetical protein
LTRAEFNLADIHQLAADLDTAARSVGFNALQRLELVSEGNGFVSTGGVGDRVFVEVIRHAPGNQSDGSATDRSQPVS